MQKWFIIIGVIFIIVGICLPWILKSGIGRLPGDIFIKKEHVTFYFPLTTGILLSIIISIVLWLINR